MKAFELLLLTLMIFFSVKYHKILHLAIFFGGGMNLCEHYRVRYGQPLDKVNPVVSITE